MAESEDRSAGTEDKLCLMFPLLDKEGVRGVVEEIVEFTTQQHPLKRIATPTDIAPLVK